MERGLSGIAGLQQTVDDVSFLKGDYWLQVDVGNTRYYDFPDYRIELVAGGVTFFGDTPTPNDAQFVTSQVPFSFDSDFTGDLTIRLLSLKRSTDDHTEIDFDNVRISDTPVPTPEPATMLLLGAGLVGIVGIGRKKMLRQ